MTPGPTLFSRIVVGVDTTIAAETALRQAITFAEQYGGEIVAVHVSAPVNVTVPIATRAAGASPRVARTATRGTRRAHRDTVNALDASSRAVYDKVANLAEFCRVPVILAFRTESPAPGLVAAARRWSAGSIAVGTHVRDGFAHFAIGSVTEALLRIAHVPVIAMHTETLRRPMKRVLVALDPGAASVLPAASIIELAAERALNVRICGVIETGVSTPAESRDDAAPRVREARPAAAGDAVERALALAQDAGIDAAGAIVEGARIAAGVCDHAQATDTDVIAIGASHDRTIEGDRQPNTVEAIVRRSHVPVIVFPVEDSPA